MSDIRAAIRSSRKNRRTLLVFEYHGSYGRHCSILLTPGSVSGSDDME